MQVGEKEEAFDIWILAVADSRPDGADVIADVKCAGRIDAGEHAFFIMNASKRIA